MSTSEPVSAFGAFRTAKEMTDAKKKKKQTSKKPKNPKDADGKPKQMNKNAGTTKSKNGNASTHKTSKSTDAAGNKDKASRTNQKTSNGKKSKPQQFKDNEIIGLVEELMVDPTKKLGKSQMKKKQELEQFLVEQLEKDDINDGELDEFDSESGSASYSEDDDLSSIDSNDYSGEYTLNESNSSQGTTDSSYTTNEKTALHNISKNKKRKSDEHKTNANDSGLTESKKSKTVNTVKSLPREYNNTDESAANKKSRKSLDQTKTEKAIITTASVKLEPLSQPHNITKVNSIAEGKRAFQWLLNPIKADDFFAKYWEGKACLIKRQHSSYFSHLISFEAIDEMLLRNHVEFTKNIDVTSYKNGIRETLNPEGRAMPPVVWDHYGQGCSIRLLNPQTFLPNLYTLSATMQEYFHCLVGANAYLTPPNSQGFAPHYDDIEAFVLQIEGRKRWKLYKPRSAAEVLPRYSSKNFEQKEIGKPILEEVLEPGDVLYFPRGTIHQASTEPGYHSLHITLSVYQKQSFADLFEKMMPLMMQKAIASNRDLRRGLPLSIWQNAGLAFSDTSSKERSELQQNVTKLLQKCIKEMPLMEIIDSAVDQCAKKFQHEALPPEILPSEKIRTVFGSRSRTNHSGECVCDYDIDERTNVRLLRANILRLVEEEQKIRIYYYLDNSKEYCEYEPNFIEIEPKEAASIEVLIKSYPSYIGVSQLPLNSEDKKITLVTALWERGLLMMEKPFK